MASTCFQWTATFNTHYLKLRDLFDAATDDYDVVIESRFLRHSVLLNYPFQKIIANRAFHALVRLVLSRPVRDLTNNCKLIKKEVIDDMVFTQPGSAINAETGMLPFVKGYRVGEDPISWISRTPEMGVSSFKLMKVGGGYWKVLINVWKSVRESRVSEARRLKHKTQN